MMRKIKTVNRCALAAMLACLVAATGRTAEKATPRCVVVWSEDTAPKNVYPHDINGAVVEGLTGLKGWEVVKANLADPDQGLPDQLLNRTDVLIWWGHKKHGQVQDELVAKIVRRVKENGMGFIALHSTHFAKANIALMSQAKTSLELLAKVKPSNRVAAWGGYLGDLTDLKITTLQPTHPIAKGVPAEFTIPHGERYNNPYAVPTPETVVFDGVYTLKNGTTSPSQQGFCWTIGKGRMFYFQPGHETNPVFFDPTIRKIIANAVLWAAP